jgi:hypothetical protein
MSQLVLEEVNKIQMEKITDPGPTIWADHANICDTVESTASRIKCSNAIFTEIKPVITPVLALFVGSGRLGASLAIPTASVAWIGRNGCSQHIGADRRTSREDHVTASDSLRCRVVDYRTLKHEHSTIEIDTPCQRVNRSRQSANSKDRHNLLRTGFQVGFDKAIGD